MAIENNEKLEEWWLLIVEKIRLRKYLIQYGLQLEKKYFKEICQTDTF